MSRRVITRVALKCNNQVLHWYLRQCLRCNISLRFFFSGVYRYYARLMVKESYHESSRASHDRSERLKNVTRQHGQIVLLFARIHLIVARTYTRHLYPWSYCSILETLFETLLKIEEFLFGSRGY